MSREQGYDDEAAVFSEYDDAPQSTEVTVREPSLPAAPQPSRQPSVPADPSPRETAYDDEGDDDLGLMSEAINQIMRAPTRVRQDVTVRTPVPTAPAPSQVPARTDTQDAPLTPREQAFLRDLREERAARQDLQRRLQPQAPAQPQQDFETRFFSNPQEILGELTQSFAQQLATVRLEQDLSLAEIRHGSDVFKTAFEAYMGQVGNGQNLPLYQRIMSSSSPGEEIVKWHRENSLLQETGGDVNAFREKIRQEVLAELQGGQRQAAPTAPAQDLPRRENGQFAARHEVRLPTATSRMNGSAAGNEDMEDGSDDAIFDAGRARRPR